jgi:AAA family ATP:ADP antiporter
VLLQVLFTVVSREEKYSAKLVIDTVIQRLGDALAAAVFQVLGECCSCAKPALSIEGYRTSNPNQRAHP